MKTQPERILFSRSRMKPGQIIQPKRGYWFVVKEKALPFCWIVTPYQPWAHR